MIERCLAYRGIRISQRAVFVDLILKYVRVDRPNSDPVFLGQRLGLRNALNTIRKIPQNMDRHRGTAPCEGMDLAGITELLIDRAGRSRLNEFPKARPGIGKSPGRNFNAQGIQRLER